MRYAIRHTTHAALELDRMARYMPSNYSVSLVATRDGNAVLISGEDVAGWTLTDYVLPRLASGLYFAREVSESEVRTFVHVAVPAA